MRIAVSAGSVMIALAMACAYGAPQQETVGQDLAATIVLHNLPCDQVIDSQRHGDSDYIATCHDGNRYHIFIDAQGHVIVQKL